MKLVVLFEDKLKHGKRENNKTFIQARDIRNYIMKIIPDEKKELKDFFAWHGKGVSPVIYQKPVLTGFAIYSFVKNSKKMMEELIEIINKNKEINLRNNQIKIKVKKVFLTKFEYCNFENGFFETKLKTPLIIGVSKTDYAKVRQATEGGDDMQALQDLTRNAIMENIKNSTKQWKNIDINDDFLDDIMILFKDFKFIPLEYKKNEYYPAVKATILSNVKLPLFLGYKTGLGYGHNVNVIGKGK